jgi:mRNA interferase RelE/StbE
MRYTLLIKKQAKRTLQSLAKTDRNRPDNPTLDIKRLQGEVYYRLRVGQWRIIFDRDDEVKIIAIEKVKPRGGAYK